MNKIILIVGALVLLSACKTEITNNKIDDNYSYVDLDDSIARIEFLVDKLIDEAAIREQVIDYAYACSVAMIKGPSDEVPIRRIYSGIMCTGSMRPTLDCEDTLKLIKPTQVEIKVCDIIVFKNNDNELILHRIIEETNGVYLTKGDANMDIDAYRPNFRDVVYKVVGIDYK